ncbi:MAG: hypothetical protein U9Q33_11580 [Campylobacterota bacterium]|nr:hypothetical protein [Campylobacterota bacterium]
MPPMRRTKNKPGTYHTLKNMSYESIVVSWLMCDGWQVFMPVIDNAHKTDILISDGPNYYRIQVKTFDANEDDFIIKNKWSGSTIDYVVLFARNSDWGYIVPAFKEKKRPLHHKTHRKFFQKRKSFLKEFHYM